MCNLSFKVYKPNNEKAKLNVLYRGAIEWNALPSNEHNLDFDDFKIKIKKDMKNNP